MPAPTDEDRRAIEYQARQRRIAATRAALGRVMAGDPAALKQIENDWLPYILAVEEERDAGADPRDCEDGQWHDSPETLAP